MKTADMKLQAYTTAIQRRIVLLLWVITVQIHSDRGKIKKKNISFTDLQLRQDMG